MESQDGKRALFRARTSPLKCEIDNSNARRPRLGRAHVYYEAGQPEDRLASVRGDPVGSENRVLDFALNRPNVVSARSGTRKGRIQMNIYDNAGVREIKFRVRMKLSRDFLLLSEYPGRIDWLTISEWWNNAGWTGEEYPFRIAVDIVKTAGRSSPDLHFRVHAQALDLQKMGWTNLIWEATNETFAIPVGEWVHLSYVFLEGARDEGRFSLEVTKEGHNPVMVIDVRDFTHHPLDPAPDGLTHWNPVKLYTSGKLIDFVSSRGGCMRIMWDDIDIVVHGGISLAGQRINSLKRDRRQYQELASYP